jgi:hypothetical protein
MLDDDPESAARWLLEYGDWRAAGDLSRAFDRLALASVADCEICGADHLVAIARAMRALGAPISEEQSARLEEALERAHPLWVPFDEPPATPFPPRAAVRRKRPGRNDPCPCGSGKKYKRCCLPADERDARH